VVLSNGRANGRKVGISDKYRRRASLLPDEAECNDGYKLAADAVG
jgi:hypothetical protein